MRQREPTPAGTGWDLGDPGCPECRVVRPLPVGAQQLYHLLLLVAACHGVGGRGAVRWAGQVSFLCESWGEARTKLTVFPKWRDGRGGVKMINHFHFVSLDRSIFSVSTDCFYNA